MTKEHIEQVNDALADIDDAQLDRILAYLESLRTHRQENSSTMSLEEHFRLNKLKIPAGSKFSRDEAYE